MRVKLVKSLNCPTLGAGYLGTSYLPPLGMAQLAGYLRPLGIEVDMEDLNIRVARIASKGVPSLSFLALTNRVRVAEYVAGNQDDDLDRIVEFFSRLVDLSGYDLVGISVDHDLKPLIPSMAAILLAHVAKKHSGQRVVVGGRGATLEWFEPELRTGLVDYLVNGYGETALDYLAAGPTSRRISIEQVPGLVYLRDDKIFRNPEQRPMVVKPDFSGLDMSLYEWEPDPVLRARMETDGRRNTAGMVMLPVKFVYGCPHRCAFCGSSLDSRLTCLQPEKAVQMLEELSKQWNTRYFYLLSDTLNFSREYFQAFCEELVRRNPGILWGDCFRPEGMDSATLELARRAGCISVIYGTESASPRLLKYINKGVSVEDVLQAVKTSHRAGLWTGVEIIAGLPTETDADIQATLRFLNDNAEYLDAVYLNSFRLLRHSEFGRYPDKFGLVNLRKIDYEDRIRISNQIPLETAFDEVGGLEWEDKIAQIAQSFATIQGGIPDRLFAYPYQELWPTLYSLYDSGFSKDHIRRVLAEHGEHMSPEVKLRDFWLGEGRSSIADKSALNC